MTDIVIDHFRKFLKDGNIDFSEASLNKNLDEIKYEIKRDLMSNKFNPNEGAKVFLTRDPASIKAAELELAEYDKVNSKFPPLFKVVVTRGVV